MLLTLILIQAWLYQSDVYMNEHEAEFRIDAGRLEVKAEIAHKSGWFILDSAGPSYIYPEFQSALRHKKLSNVEDEGKQVPRCELTDFRCGGAAFSNVMFRVADKTIQGNYSVGASLSVDGVLGYDIIRQTCIAFDFSQDRIWL